MSENKRKIYKNTFSMLMLIFIVAIIAKIYEYNFMEKNAFTIINYIMNGINNGIFTGDKSFDFPIKVLSFLRIFNFSTVYEAGIICAIIMNIICFLVLLLANEKYTFKEYIFIFSTIFILNFTVFDLNKDVIQFLFVLLIYCVISNQKIKKSRQIIYTMMILLFETIFFRSYYILIVGLFPLIYFLLKGVAGKEIKNKKRIALKIILIFIFFFTTIFLMQYIAYESYLELVNRRNRLEYIEANTIIRNIFQGTSYFYFCVNYFVNLIRCLFPIEICTKGTKYIIFAFYQIFITISIIKALKNINKNNILFISFILSYCMTMAASESDFGTFVRHQSVLLFFYVYIIKNLSNEKIKSKNIIKNSNLKG